MKIEVGDVRRRKNEEISRLKIKHKFRLKKAEFPTIPLSKREDPTGFEVHSVSMTLGATRNVEHKSSVRIARRSFSQRQGFAMINKLLEVLR